jgi:hypothetical protein
MSDSNEYKLEDLQKLSRPEIKKIAKGFGINLKQKLEKLIKQIIDHKLRIVTIAEKKRQTKKEKTRIVKVTKPQTKKLSPRKKESSRSSKSSSSKRETPSPISEREKLFLNKQLVQSVISRIIINDYEYAFLKEIDFNYTGIIKLLNIDYTNDWPKNFKTVKDYLESKNILKLAEDLYLIFKYVNELKKKIDSINVMKQVSKTQVSKIEKLCDIITNTIIIINKNIASQPNNFIKIKEEYKNSINTDIDNFNSHETITTNKFTITNKLI